MKKSELKQIIREEIKHLLKEGSIDLFMLAQEVYFTDKYLKLSPKKVEAALDTFDYNIGTELDDIEPDTEKTYDNYNKFVQKYLGYTLEQLRGKLIGLSPEDNNYNIKNLQKTNSNGFKYWFKYKYDGIDMLIGSKVNISKLSKFKVSSSDAEGLVS